MVTVRRGARHVSAEQGQIPAGNPGTRKFVVLSGKGCESSPKHKGEKK
jgi:hypothetical protein